jgi:hypothetical protein
MVVTRCCIGQEIAALEAQVAQLILDVSALDRVASEKERAAEQNRLRIASRGSASA